MKNMKINNILAKVFLFATLFVHMGVRARHYYEPPSAEEIARATVNEQDRRIKEAREEVVKEAEREVIDERNAEWMKEKSILLTKIMEKKIREYGKAPDEYDLFGGFGASNDRDNLASVLGMRKEYKRTNYLGYVKHHNDTNTGDYYYACRKSGEYNFQKWEATEQDGLWFLQDVECLVKYSLPLSDKYYNQFKNEWNPEYSPRFLLAENTYRNNTSQIFLYDTGTDVVPMKISLDKEHFTMYTPGAEIKLPSQTKAHGTIHYFFYNTQVDSGHGFLDRKTRITATSAYGYSDLVVRDAKDPVLREDQYLGLSFESARDYIFRQELVDPKKANKEKILCIVVRPKSQSKATPLSAQLKQKISQLSL